MSENKCPRCNEVVPKGVFICPGCAIDIREWNPDKLRCPVCRGLYPKGTKFCLKDGSPLEEAVLNFDTEATMFLSSSPQLAEKKDDLIPGLRFAEDRERIIPKLERDEKGHLAPPLKPAEGESEVVMPDISFEFHAPKEEAPPPPSAQSPPKKIFWAYDPERQQETAPPAPEPAEEKEILSPPPKIKQPYKIKPLEEYEQLLKEEEEREAMVKPARPAPIPKPAAAKPEPREARTRRGFFQRLMDALKILLNK
ncbi:MAG: hypothetical protein BWY12_00175 [candidate division BRC1 bacterium ADurb.Bin183]|nr:MAG: hypothetical protein BWY12_00175 [candidate division BRC1 bacterium ADurb.Bin183]